MAKNTEEKETERRAELRRTADRVLLKQVKRYRKLYQVGQIITSGIQMGDVFETIMEQTNAIMNAERSTVFLYEEQTDQLRSIAATGAERNEIRIASDHGIAGWVFKNRRAQIINNPYGDPRFFSGVDQATGFKTRNILCIPLINRKGECIGSLQALNAKGGDFTSEDLGMLESVGHYVSIALDNARLYEDLALMDKAKERVISHLSHELKTPLAILSAVFDRLIKQLGMMSISKLEKTARRGQRNLLRLLDLQEKIDDILNQRQIGEKKTVLHIIETAVSLLEEIGETGSEKDASILKQAAERVESIFHAEKPDIEKIRIDEFIRGVCDNAERNMGDRRLEIVRDLQPGVALTTSPAMLEKVLSGLLKNAVENTPDEGKIIFSCHDDGDAAISVRDFGVGISPTNQKLIFSGFVHTQETELYSSKRRYAFNAGGAGVDLFRIKAFSERFGFTVSYESARCRHIPGDADLCPGRISDCPHAADRRDCLESGGSVFTVRFPGSGKPDSDDDFSI